MPEVLAPCGDFERLIAAIKFGADAVYLAGEEFGMRAAATNFNNENLCKAVSYAHE
ncbi:MAG: U32 family peptidase, partial [Niameybacter sp.]